MILAWDNIQQTAWELALCTLSTILLNACVCPPVTIQPATLWLLYPANTHTILDIQTHV
jgi:hypothetical protein